MKLNLRRKSLWRGALLVVLVAALAWYAANKRAEWEEMTRPIGNVDDATAVLAPASNPSPAAEAEENSAVFALARLERDRVRAGQEENLRSLAGDTSLPESSREEAASQLTSLAGAKAREAQLEQMLREKGFADALVTLNEGSARIVLRHSGELSQQQLAQIGDAARQVAGLKPWDLSIVTRP